MKSNTQKLIHVDIDGCDEDLLYKNPNGKLHPLNRSCLLLTNEDTTKSDMIMQKFISDEINESMLVVYAIDYLLSNIEEKNQNYINKKSQKDGWTEHKEIFNKKFKKDNLYRQLNVLFDH